MHELHVRHAASGPRALPPVAAATLQVFVACAPGLEPLLRAELESAGVAVQMMREEAGGISATLDHRTLYRLHLVLGLALKVLVRLGSFPARHFEVLVKRAEQLPWDDWIGAESEVRVKASCKSSKLYHSGAVAERVQRAIATRLGRPPSPPTGAATGATGATRRGSDTDPERRRAETARHEEAPWIEVHARLEHDTCTLSVDVSGALLHRRGYRLATAKAPLREDLARALLIVSGWDREEPLLDPFCGSGTILLEADWLARRVPCGHLRRFAFMQAPCFDPAQFAAVQAEALAEALPQGPTLLGSDRDAGAIRAARSNAERAGSRLELCQAPLASSPFLAPGGAAAALVTNPPYGLRIGREARLDALYRALGAAVQRRAAPTHIGLAVAQHEHAQATGLRLASALMTDHGGSKIYLVTGRHAPGSEQ